MVHSPLDKRYDPQRVEEKWMKRWEDTGLFRADTEASGKSFSMVIPPPNVTGSLHLGHALNNTLQDILARWKRMSGNTVLWLPGTDHAGIATQNVVERQLAKEGSDRHDLGREKFIERIWNWKKESGGIILKQLKRLGASCDWDRERFTMDEGLSRAVREVFLRLYKEGLIYRDKRLINLCPHCRTALSDIEVEHDEVQSKMYSIKYPLVENVELFLTVATTRPETMLGDTAVAVHPEDPRFNQWIGKEVKLPLTDRTIPIIADPILVDREFGTGAVKITPGHDFNDEKSGKRHNLKKISLIDWSGEMNPWALQEEARAIPEIVKTLACQSMIDARAIVVRELDKAELLTKTEEHTMALGKCYRCKTVVEPFDSPQWFVKVNDPDNSLAQPAIRAVREAKIRLIPASWEPNYFGWMESIEDWCISRQIWWGHQIPVWYCKKCDKDVLISSVGVGAATEGAALSEPMEEVIHMRIDARPIVGETSCPRCGGSDLIQDPDVLDTWFSSALWPFSTLGWPAALQADDAAQTEAKTLLERFYPTSVLVSGFDILFFWVARMIMMGLHFMNAVPFKTVYIHALVRDAEGQKMSKSKGNVIDPLEIMKEYGTDALRFTLASMASPGRDIKLSEERIEGYRNFCNKIWNAARFIQMNRSGTKESRPSQPDTNEADILSRWIRFRLDETIRSVEKALEVYRFDEAAKAVYQFVWHTYCDWYLELVKVDLEDAERRRDAIRVMEDTFGHILKLLHPFMPFLTEELWSRLQGDDGCLAGTDYPKPSGRKRDLEAEKIVKNVINGTVTYVRNCRGELNISSSELRPMMIKIRPDKPDYEKRFETHLPYIKRLARLGEVTIGQDIDIPEMALNSIPLEYQLCFPVTENECRAAIDRCHKKLDNANKGLEKLKKKLDTPSFCDKAPKEIVNKARQERAVLIDKKNKLSSDLLRFQNLLSNPSTSS
ncbi:MAG: valine--tRNA ligase [Nitrospiria bacterium]